MNAILRTALVAAVAFGGVARAANLASVDRTIRKEPAYQTKSPRYALLVFGHEARDRVWLVHDGDTLYVDRNGDGDLTDAGNKVTAKGREPTGGYRFTAGELPIGGRAPKGLTVHTLPVSKSSDMSLNHPNVKAALAGDPAIHMYLITVELDVPGMKGAGVGGRVTRFAGWFDTAGALLFGDKPATAPVIHFDGPLQVTFYREKPQLMLERDNDVMLAVGTPGAGPGTFAMLAYEGAIPDAAVPQIQIEFPPQKPGAPPVRQSFELRQRC